MKILNSETIDVEMTGLELRAIKKLIDCTNCVDRVEWGITLAEESVLVDIAQTIRRALPASE